MKGFKLLYEDTPGGKYLRKVDKGRYHMIEWVDMIDACGRDNDGKPQYCVDLGEVDLWYLSAKQIDNARRSCGWEEMDDNEESLIEMCHSHGYKAILHSVLDDDLDKALEECRKASRQYARAKEPHEEKMTRAVNRIGSTAREMMYGNVYEGIVRGISKGNDEAKVVAKMYGASDEDISRMEGQGPGPQGCIWDQVDLHKGRNAVQDPLPYMMGYRLAVSGKGPDACGLRRSSLAEAFIEGFRRGIGVLSGEEGPLEWIT